MLHLLLLSGRQIEHPKHPTTTPLADTAPTGGGSSPNFANKDTSNWDQADLAKAMLQAQGSSSEITGVSGTNKSD